MVAAPPAAARAGLHHRRHPDPVPGDTLVQLPELLLERARRRALDRDLQLQGSLHRPQLPQRAVALGDDDRDRGHRRDAPRHRARGPARKQIPRPPHCLDPHHHAVPGHARRRRADLVGPDARPELRAAQLAARAVRGQPRGLADQPRLRIRDRGDGLAVDAVHDPDRARGPAGTGRRRGRGGQRRRGGRAGEVPRADPASSAPVHRARRAARLDLPGDRVRPGEADDQRRPGHLDHDAALLPVPEGELCLRHRRGGRGGRGHRGADDHRRQLRAAPVRQRLPLRGGKVTALADAPGAEPSAPAQPRRSRRAREMYSLAGWTVLGWVVGIAFFIPVLWMVITAFKPEASAETWPPKFTFSPTLAEFRVVFNGATPAWPFIEHSAIATVGSTILVLVLALPAAYALSLRPVGGWRDSLFFFISTKMLPVVAAIGPLYVIALKTHLLDSIWLLIILYAAMNLPLAIWMIRSFMLEVPTEMLEAARLDGAGRIREITEVIMPVVSPGLVSTALICIIFAWNELFLALNLTVTNAATMPMFLISSVPQEGLYIAHLSAAATVASVPVILVGWVAQRSLVRGLSMGAIK